MPDLLSRIQSPAWLTSVSFYLEAAIKRVPAVAVTSVLAILIGVVVGYAAILFEMFIETVSGASIERLSALVSWSQWWWAIPLMLVPAAGLLITAWLTRRFAPETGGAGVPEVKTALARNDGSIRMRVSVIKFFASGLCIGLGGSVGREGPIVQIGASIASTLAQSFRLSPRNVKVLVAAGAAAGISATFRAPLAGVMFASEIILVSFAIESLTPIAIGAVVANVVQTRAGNENWDPAFQQLNYEYLGDAIQLPSLAILGVICGLASVSFTRAIFSIDQSLQKRIPAWWQRALFCGAGVGVIAVCYFAMPRPGVSPEMQNQMAAGKPLSLPLLGVGTDVIEHSLHLRNEAKQSKERRERSPRNVVVNNTGMLQQLVWLLPLVFLKPLLTSITLAGGGSGGVFAPSLFLGATLGACFGLVCNLIVPESSANPGLYAIVGMGAVVAGTTHGLLSAILIVYEMTNNYEIILPIMMAAGLSSAVARMIDPQSIYQKRLHSRGMSITHGHDTRHLEHVMVRQVMLRNFPSVKQTDPVTEVVRVARANSSMAVLPVVNEENRLVGVIRPEAIRVLLESDISTQLVNADDLAEQAPASVSPSDNLIEAMREFGVGDLDVLTVETVTTKSRRLVGILLLSDVMRRYREELLRVR